MKKVYIGNICKFNNEPCLVVYVKDDMVALLAMRSENMYRAKIENIEDASDVLFQDMYFSMKGYNKIIENTNAKFLGKFSKNEKEDLIFEDGSHIWFTSDTHFGHTNILKFNRSGFQSVEEMNEAIIHNWNTYVKEDDIVFHLGDFAFGGAEVWKSALERLNGHIHLILGNHDIKNFREGYLKYFESVSFQRQITIEGRSVYLNHYPFLTYGGVHRKEDRTVWQLFGHVHSNNRLIAGADSYRLTYLFPSQMDVGIDASPNFAPISWGYVKKHLNDLSQKFIEDKQEDIEKIKWKNELLYNLLTEEQKEKYNTLLSETNNQ